MNGNDDSHRSSPGVLTVPARLFSDSQPGIGTDGTLTIGATSVEFRADDAVSELPLAGLSARVSGFDDRTLFLTHPAHPGVEITTVAPEALTAPAIASLASLAASLDDNRASRTRFWGCTILVGLVALAIVVVLVIGFLLGIGWVRALFGT